MFTHCLTDSTEGKDLLIDFVSEALKSIVSFKISDNFISTTFSGIKYLFKQSVEKLYYPIEVFKYGVIYGLKNNENTVLKQIQNLKNQFEKFIRNSDKWILHFCWISLITELILYRPSIKRSTDVGETWSQLVENQLVQQTSFNQKRGLLVLFQNNEQLIYNADLSTILIKKRQRKLKQFVQFLLEGEQISNFEILNYYKKFSFTNNNINSGKKDYEIILITDEEELLNKYIKQFQEKINKASLIYKEILDQSIQEVNEKIQLEDFKQIQKIYVETWAEAFILIKMIREFTLYEIKKIDLLHSCFKKSQNELVQPYKNIQESTIQLDKFEKKLLKKYFSLLTNIYKTQTLGQTQTMEEQNKEEQQLLIDVKSMEFEKFTILYDNLKGYKKLFTKFTDKIQQDISFQEKNQIEYFDNIYSRKWISRIEMEKDFLLEIKCKNSMEEQIQILNYNISNLRLLKQLLQFQEQRINQVQNKLSQFQNGSQSQLTIETNNPHQQIIIVLEKILEQLNKINSELQNHSELFIKKDLKLFLQQLKLQIESFQILDQQVVQNQKNANDSPKDTINLITLIQKIYMFLIQLRYDYLIKLQNNISNTEQVQYKEKIGQKDQNQPVNNINDTDQQIVQNKITNQEIQKDLGNLEKEQQNSIEKLKDEITKQIEEWKNKSSSTQTQQNQNNENNKQEDYNNNLKVISAIKKIKHFFKSYKELLIIKPKKGMADLFKEKINKFYNDEIQKINEYQQIIQSEKKEQKSKNIWMVGFIDFLQFYEQNLEQDYQDKQENSGFFYSIWSDVKKFYQQIQNQTVDIFEDKDYKVRECLVFHLIKIQQSNLEDCLIQFSTKQLQQIWCYEKDQRVRNLLKNKELVEMQKLFFKRDLQSFSDQIKEDMQGKIQFIDQIQEQIRLQGNQKEREKLIQQLNQVYQDLDESLDNISEMSQIMDINLVFLKDIMKNVKEIKASIDNLQDSVNKLSDDIRKLRGKKYGELLDIRMNKVFAQMDFQEIDSVYVQLITRERILPGRELKQGSKLFIDNIVDTDGEINEFIWKETNEKDVVLISGFAGSGKSRAVKKIEEFLWKLKQDELSKWIPIYVSLPTLKNPKFNLFEQALESENYQFDKYQIREFKQAIQDKQERIVLILDSYDEMKAECIQQNLISTNKLIQDLSIDKDDRQVKFMITTRREILTTEGYEDWFKGESLKTYKEIQLLNFNEQQQEDYLNQYCELSVKRIIKSLYEFFKSVQNQNFDIKEFKSIWQQLHNKVVDSQLKSPLQNKQDFIFLDKFNQTSKIIQEIKTIKIFKNASQEQLIGLKKDLESLWNANKFNKTIKTAQLKNLLTTPFMLEIVVQVLPNMIKNYQGSTQIRDTFKFNFNKIIQTEKLSKNQINMIKENKLQILNGSNQDTEQDQKETLSLFAQIMDKLEEKNFFQKYSLDSEIQKKGDLLLVDYHEIQITHVDIIIRALKMQNLTAFEFYQNFINYYHEQQIQKLRDLGHISNQQSFAQDIHQYSLSLALDMTIRDLSQIEYQEKGKLILQSNYKVAYDVDNWLDQYLGSQSSDYDYKKLIKSCTLLSAKGSMYSFTHKSIQEFYVAYFIFNFLNSIDIENNKEKILKSVFNQRQFNISTDGFMAACNFIIEKLKTVEFMQENLIKIVQLSKQQEYIRASSNSIYLLSLLQVYLEKKDFSQIKLENTNISKLCFVNSDLSQSQFKNVQIDQCNFNNCDLSDIDWQDIKCQEQPSIQIKDQFKKFQFTQDGKNIILVTKQGNIEIRNSLNFEKEQGIDQDGLIKLNKNEDNFIIINRNHTFISEIKMADLQKNDFLDCLYFKQSKDLKSFYIQTQDYFRVQSNQQLKQSRNIKQKENQEKIQIGDTDSLFQFSPDCSILVYTKQKNLYFSNLGESKSLIICDSKIHHLEFCKNGSYFICATEKKLHIFKKIDKKESIDFEELINDLNVDLSNHNYFLDHQTLYVIDQLKSIRIFSIKDKKEGDIKQFQLEQEKKEQNQNQNSKQENEQQEDLYESINKILSNIHLIFQQNQQQLKQQQQQFFILFSTSQQIYFNNPEQKKLCKVNQKHKIKQILIFPNYTLSNIQFILATNNDKIIIYRISHKDKDFRQLLERQLYLKSFKIQDNSVLSKKYTLSNDGKTLFLQYGNELRWYLITEDQANGVSIIGQSIVSINNFTNTDVHDLYFSDLDHFLIISQEDNKKFYEKIQFSKILFQININIFRDSEISQSEDEQVTLVSNQQKKSIIYFHHKNLDLYELEQISFNTIEVIDQIAFMNITQTNKKFKIQLCKFKKNNSQLTIDSKEIRLIGEQFLYYKYFQKLKLLVIQDSDKFLQIINVKNQQIIEKIKENQKIYHISISPDSQVLGYVRDNEIKFWNINQNQKPNSEIPQSHQKEVSAITFSKDGLLIASGDTDGRIILWDYQNFQYLVQFSEHKESISQLLFYIRNSNQILVSCCDESILKTWNTQYPYQDTVSTYTIKTLYPIHTISMSESQISLTYKDCLFLYDYNLEGKIKGQNQFYNIQTQFQISCISHDNNFLYPKNKSINIINLQTSNETQIKNISSKKCAQMIISDDNKYLILIKFDYKFNERVSKISILNREEKQNWKLINEVIQFYEVESLKISSDSKILAIQVSSSLFLYNFDAFKDSIFKFENDLDDYHIYSVTDDFRYAVIFKEGRFNIKLKNRENKESNFRIFSYKNSKKKLEKYQLIDPKISKNQKFLAAVVNRKKLIVVWEVDNPIKQYLIPLKNKQGENLYEFSCFNNQDYIFLVNLNEDDELISIYSFNLNLQKFEEQIRKIKSNISKNYCFSQTQQYFCILNINQSSGEQNYLLEFYGVRNDQLDQRIQIEDVEEYESDVSMAFSKDDTVFAIRIDENLYGYKMKWNKFTQFLKITIPSYSVIRILKDNTRIFLFRENSMLMCKIDINNCQIAKQDQKGQYLMRELVSFRVQPFSDLMELQPFTIHQNEDKILLYNNNEKSKILIIDLLENLLLFQNNDQLIEFCFSQNSLYFATLYQQQENFLLKINKFEVQKNLTLEEKPVFKKIISGNSIQFLDNETKKILVVEEGIIVKRQKQLVLYNIIKGKLEKIFKFDLRIGKFVIKGEICLIQSDCSCYIFKINEEQKFIRLHQLPYYNGLLFNNNYFQFLQKFDSQTRNESSDSEKLDDIQQDNDDQQDLEHNDDKKSEQENDGDINHENLQFQQEKNENQENRDDILICNDESEKKSDQDNINQQERHNFLIDKNINFEEEDYSDGTMISESIDDEDDKEQIDDKNDKEQIDDKDDKERIDDKDDKEQIDDNNDKEQIDDKDDKEQIDDQDDKERIDDKNDKEQINDKDDKEQIDVKCQDSSSDYGDPDDQVLNNSIIVHLDNLPKFIHQHDKIIKFHQMLPQQNEIYLIDQQNNKIIFQIENHEKKADNFENKEEVIQYENENFFFVKVNKDYINMYQKTENSSSYQKLNQQLQITDLEKSKLVFSNNGNYLLKQQNNCIEIINFNNKKPIVKCENIFEITGVNLFALFPDGYSFVTGQSDGSIKLFKVNSDQVSKIKFSQQNSKSIICYKSFAVFQDIQSNGCKLSAKSNIISSNKNDLKELFKSRGAQDDELKNESSLNTNPTINQSNTNQNQKEFQKKNGGASEKIQKKTNIKQSQYKN